MQLTEAEIERLRRSGIRLDAEGRFHHEGEVIRHAGLVAALWRWLDRNPDGRYVLRLDPARFVYLDVDDAPHLARSLRLEDGRAILLLADGTEEPLDPRTIRFGPAGTAYCRVRAGRLDARLAPSALAALADRITERDGCAWLDLDGGPYSLGPLDRLPAP